MTPSTDPVRAIRPIARAAGVVVGAVAAFGLGLAPSLASAQTTPLSLSIDASVAASDNGALAPGGQERRELITSFRPRLAIARRGAGLEFDLEAAVTLLGFANGTQQSGVWPDLRARVKATVLERLLYFGAAAQVRQAEADAFGSRASESVGANSRTESSYSVSPYLERELWPDISLLARHDASLTTHGAGAGERLVSNRSLLRLERKPVPLGAAVELSRLENEQRGATDGRFTLETALLRGSWALLDNRIVLGAVAGVDRSELMLERRTDPLYGVSAVWRPGPRTELAANVEQRFFGRSVGLTFRHRLPWTSIAVALNRQPVLASTSLGVQGLDLRTFLDAILTTRNPDPTQRSAIVDATVTNRALETRDRGAINVVAQYPQLQTDARVTWVVLGSRNTAVLSAYAITTRQLAREGDALTSALPANADNRQVGGSFQFNRRLTPLLTAGALLQWSKITGLAARAGDSSDDRTYRLTLTQALSPRTGASAGVQHVRFTTTVSGKHPYDATLLFIGVSHRF